MNHPQEPVPVRLQLDQAGRLVVTWSDSEVLVSTPDELYAANPAADARHEREQQAAQPRGAQGGSGENELGILPVEETRPRTITAVEPVGNYAYAIRFSYGSSNGIYRFDLLRQLGRPAN
jgi:DUF971 family protein